MLAVVLLALTSATAAAVALAVTTGATALIMGGTGHPLSTPPDPIDYVERYLGTAVANYIAPASTTTGVPAGPYNRLAVITPEQFAPDYGTLTYDRSVAQGVAALDNCIRATDCVYNPGVGSTAPTGSDSFVVFGFSQSSTIAALEKRDLAARQPSGTPPAVSFVVIADGNRPNGGFLARGPQGLTIPRPLLYGGATFSGPMPTDTGYPTVDLARQYDGWADFPLNPLNLLADANALAGVTLLHLSSPGYAAISLDDPSVIDQGSYGDTSYYLAPTPILPLLMPLSKMSVVGYALADSWDPVLRVMVEAGYNRTISPGQPARWNPFYVPNPLKLTRDLIVAVPTGADNGVQDLFGRRPFGTVRPGPFGVGGPDVTPVGPTAATPEPVRRSARPGARASTVAHGATVRAASAARRAAQGRVAAGPRGPGQRHSDAPTGQ